MYKQNQCVTHLQPDQLIGSVIYINYMNWWLPATSVDRQIFPKLPPVNYTRKCYIWEEKEEGIDSSWKEILEAWKLRYLRETYCIYLKIGIWQRNVQIQDSKALTQVSSARLPITEQKPARPEFVLQREWFIFSCGLYLLVHGSRLLGSSELSSVAGVIFILALSLHLWLTHSLTNGALRSHRDHIIDSCATVGPLDLGALVFL